jgi:nucleotide-binding universal stress UspA family protein
MATFRRILSPRDFSPASERALEHALDLAGRTGADLHLLHAEVLYSDPFREREAEARALPVEVVRESLRHLSDGGAVEATDAAGSAGDVRYEVVRDIAAAPAIVRHAEAHDVDLIVMGTHGRRGMRRLLLGSVTEEVVRAASCAVMAVRADGPGPADGPLLVPVDFSAPSQTALRRGRDLAALYGVPLHVLHVAHIAPYPSFYGADAFSWTDLPRKVLDDAEQELTHFVRATEGLRGATFEATVGVGTPFRVITEYAQQNGAGLIVMGRRGLSGLQHVLLGSTTERVLRNAPCPVFITRHEEGGSPGTTGADD